MSAMRSFPEFILASRSPRRRELLTKAGYRFRVIPPAIDEPVHIPPGVPPAHVAEALAYFKAKSVSQANPEWIVLGADTVVTCAGRAFGKADDEDEARRMLRGISGTRHTVTTALAVLAPTPAGAPRRYIVADTTVIVMRDLADEEIDAYVAGGEWRDKAGAYAIQETGDRFVVKVDGSFSNVVGLPMELVARMLAAVDERGRPRSSGV